MIKHTLIYTLNSKTFYWSHQYPTTIPTPQVCSTNTHQDTHTHTYTTRSIHYTHCTVHTLDWINEGKPIYNAVHRPSFIYDPIITKVSQWKNGKVSCRSANFVRTGLRGVYSRGSHAACAMIKYTDVTDRAR